MTERSSGRGRAKPAVETELKLRIPPRRLAALVLPGSSGRALRGETLRLAAIYFDTPGLDLWRRRIALRVRREGGRWVQTVKGGGEAASGLHRRIEIEAPVQGPRPDLPALPRHPVTRILRARKVAAALAPVFRTEIVRSLRLLEPAPGVVIEAAVDRGFVRSGRRREAVSEIELELKSGPVIALFDLARQLAARTPLALEHRSKAERGYDLFRGAVPAPEKARLLRLRRNMNAGEAFRAIAAAAVAQIQANEHGTLHGDDPEYLHQMRVGLRRLRSALRLFRDRLGDETRRLDTALRAVGAALGAARDWDVLVTETLAEVSADLPPHTLPPAFHAACRREQSRNRKILKKYLISTGYNYSGLMLGAWLAELDGLGRDAAWREPARVCAVRILTAWHARVLKRGRRLRQRSDEELHRLRIAVKQLRYALEFFSALFAPRAVAVLRGRLVELQNRLGRINDAAAVAPLVERAAGGRARALREAAGIVIGSCEARAAQERIALQEAWRRFRAAPKPWRG